MTKIQGKEDIRQDQAYLWNEGNCSNIIIVSIMSPDLGNGKVTTYFQIRLKNERMERHIVPTFVA